MLGVFCFTAGPAAALLAAEAPAAPPRSSLTAILDHHAQATFDDVSAYLKAHPEASDAERARRWLFETALARRLEPHAADAAASYLGRADPDPQTLALARQVRTISLAAAGEWEAALNLYDGHLRTLSLRSPNDALELAGLLATEAQLAGDAAVVRVVYERLSDRFFLNAAVRDHCDLKLAKLGLVGQPVPPIELTDLDGNPIDLAAYRGKLLLIDFWATNCPPCLEEFPALKQLHAEFHDDGFEIVGLSLDENRTPVDEFQKTWKLPWRIALADADGEETRQSFRVATIPATFLVDRTGKVIAFDLKGPALRGAIEQHLKPNPP